MTTKKSTESAVSRERQNFRLIIGAPVTFLLVFCFSYLQYTSGGKHVTDATPHTKTSASTHASASPIRSNANTQAGLTTVADPTDQKLSSSVAPSQIPNPANTTTPQSSSKTSLQGNSKSTGNSQKALLNLKISN